MTSLSQKAIASLQAYKLLVLKRALHPEFFEIRQSRSYRDDFWELEAWLARGQHLMRFSQGSDGVVEVVTPDERSIPDQMILLSLPCAGERDYESRTGDHINYMSTVQTEVASESIFRANLEEMEEYALQNEAMLHRWRAENCRLDSMSILDAQCFKREVHVQTWHYDATCYLIVRSQAIFELVDLEVAS